MQTPTIVTLVGFVATDGEKYAAETAAPSVCGVAGIANDIVVKPIAGAYGSRDRA